MSLVNLSGAPRGAGLWIFGFQALIQTRCIVLFIFVESVAAPQLVPHVDCVGLCREGGPEVRVDNFFPPEPGNRTKNVSSLNIRFQTELADPLVEKTGTYLAPRERGWILALAHAPHVLN